MKNETQEERDAIAAFLKNKTVTVCPPGSAMKQVEKEKRVRRARQEMISMTGSTSPRCTGSSNNKSGKAAYAQRNESRMVRRIGTKQLREKGIIPEKHK